MGGDAFKLNTLQVLMNWIRHFVLLLDDSRRDVKLLALSSTHNSSLIVKKRALLRYGSKTNISGFLISYRATMKVLQKLIKHHHWSSSSTSSLTTTTTTRQKNKTNRRRLHTGFLKGKIPLNFHLPHKLAIQCHPRSSLCNNHEHAHGPGRTQSLGWQ